MMGASVTLFLRRHWPLWVALAFLASAGVLTVRACLAATGGHFVYALDDPYITMAMARTLVRHGTWGVTPADFSSSCSSPLWLLCVAATYAVFGVNDLSPLVLQLLERATRAGAAYVVGTLAIVAIVAIALVNRAQAAWWRTTSASREIFEQQYQMGLFLHRFFENRRVAANDIGAINYQAAIESFDLVGLANIDVARARLEGHYDTAAVDRLTRAHGVELAIVYKPWFEGIGGLPPAWIEVGAWTSAERVVTGGATVSFYAVDPRATGALTQSLRLFSGQLPAGVVQSGAYLTASQAR
jgi:hypothetical protein